MDGIDPEEFLIYETYFEDGENNLNQNEGCCSTLVVLAIIMILVNLLIV